MTASQRLALGKLLRTRKDEIAEFHHGDCVGADAEAHVIAAQHLGIDKVFVHPPSNDKKRAFCSSPHIVLPAPYLARNLAIIRMTDGIVAAPKSMTEPTNPRGQGTWHVIRHARYLGRAIYLLAP